MDYNDDILLEHVLKAVMASDAGTLSLWAHLREELPDIRVTALIRALLAADRLILDTFAETNTARNDAVRARAMALALSEAANAVEAQDHSRRPLLLHDLPA